MPFTFSTSWVPSSITPGMVENSWITPPIFMRVTAAPGIDEKSTRRKALPSGPPWPG